MKKIALVVLLAAGIALAASSDRRFKYQMLNCPTSLSNQYDENFVTQCAAPPYVECGGGTCTHAAPTAATEGMSLSGLSGWRLHVCAPQYYQYSDAGLVIYSDAGIVSAPETLSGAGKMIVYLYDANRAQWIHNPTLDFAVSVTGEACQNWPDQPVSVSADRVMVEPSGITVALADGGTTDAGLDVFLDGQVNTKSFAW